MATTPEVVREAARGALDYDLLRPGQGQALHALASGHDTLVVMPTGSGKSAIYQIAAHLIPGLCLVVSPLIALQRDQLDALHQAELGDAAVLNSTLSGEERHAISDQITAGTLKFLLLAPEQLAHAATLELLQAAQPALFVVDEAHCISEWGHDFRPDYLHLGAVIAALNQPRVLALTATAAPPVRAEIVERLGMRAPQVIVRGFDRPNLWLGVETFHDAEAKRHALLERITAAAKPGIVYVATRQHAEDVAAALTERGVPAAPYHAGMATEERERVQTAFMTDALAVIVATTAFGMGIDKPNVRFVFHEHISEAVDAYYQEIGRAGRDGAPAQAILFYRPEDVGVRRFLAASAPIDPADVQQVVETLQEADEPVDAREIRKETDLAPGKVNTILDHLADAGAVNLTPTGEATTSAEPLDVHAVAEEVAAAQEQRRQIERSRVEMMQGYAETRDCRRAYILNYFGEAYDPPCDNCDNCQAGYVAAATPTADLPFALNRRVRHASLGAGAVMRYEGDTITILFDTAGYQMLDLNLVRELDLLHAEED